MCLMNSREAGVGRTIQRAGGDEVSEKMGVGPNQIGILSFTRSKKEIH